MTACTILYASFYGSTKEYADELAKRLGTTAEPIPDADFTPEGPIVVLAPIHGPNNPGASFIRKLPDPLFDAHSAQPHAENTVHVGDDVWAVLVSEAQLEALGERFGTCRSHASDYLVARGFGLLRNQRQLRFDPRDGSEVEQEPVERTRRQAPLVEESEKADPDD